MKLTNHKHTPYIVGLTGGIGSGKSTVSHIFRSKGYAVIDADEVAREVVLPNSVGLNEIIDHFGNEILTSEGALDRRKLGDYVFNHPKALKVLNEILHPLIRNRIAEKIKSHNNEAILFIDVPLLFETDQKDNYNEIVLIYVEDDIALNRIILRDHISKELAIKKIRSQMPIETKRQLADYVIENIDTQEQLDEAVLEYLQNLSVRANNWQKNNEH